MASQDRLVWIDCEMTGLDLDKDQLVEIAVIVTEADLTELDSGINIIIRPDDLSILEGMDPVVVDMHTASGLLDVIPDGVSLAEAEEQVLAYVRQHVPDARKAEATQKAIEGPLTPLCPASILRLHPSCLIALDPPAASTLTVRP